MPRAYNVININGHIVPATRHDAYKKLLVAVADKRVTAQAAQRYVSMKADGSSCLCAIGALLSPEQLEEVRSTGLNRGSVGSLRRRFGVQNLQAMTSLNSRDADRLQDRFDIYAADDAIGEFENRLREQIANTVNYPNPATEHTGAWHFPVSGQ
jgi:hypothetical protein